MLSLLAKDFRLLFSSSESGKKKVITAITSLLFLALFRTVEVFLFVGVLQKLKSYPDVPFAYRTLFLFVLSLARIVSLLRKCEKLFYRGEDLTQLSTLPVRVSTRFFSKLITVFLYQWLRETLLIYPLFIAYGVRFHRPVFFYFLAFLYPVFCFFFEAGVARILLPVYHIIISYLHDRPLLFLGCGLIIRGVFAFLYGKGLNIFVQLVSDQDLTLLFTTENRQKRIHRQKYLFITNIVLKFIVKNSGLHFFLWFAFGLGTFFLGLIVTIPSYQAVLHKGEKDYTRKKRDKKQKLSSPLLALAKKERQLLFSDSENLYSFTGLLLVGPYLGYLIVFALNTIFSKGILGYYLALFPNVSESIAYFVFVFLSRVRLSGANDYLSREKGGIILRKTRPISISKQLWRKILIPFSALSLSLLARCLTRIFTKSRSAFYALSGLFSSLLLCFSYSLLSRRGERKKGGSKGGFFSYLAPFVLLGLSLILNYNKVPFYACFIILVLLSLLCTGLIFFLFKKKKNQRFLAREVNA